MRSQAGSIRCSARSRSRSSSSGWHGVTLTPTTGRGRRRSRARARPSRRRTSRGRTPARTARPTSPSASMSADPLARCAPQSRRSAPRRTRSRPAGRRPRRRRSPAATTCCVRSADQVRLAARRADRLVERRDLHRPHPGQGERDRLDGAADDVVGQLLRGHRRPDVWAATLIASERGSSAPNSSRIIRAYSRRDGADLRDLGEEVHAAVDEQGDARREACRRRRRGRSARRTTSRISTKPSAISSTTSIAPSLM